MVKITRTMTIQEITEKAPHAIKILFESGMHCVGCHIATMETLEEGAKAHGLSDKKINEIVKKINQED